MAAARKNELGPELANTVRQSTLRMAARPAVKPPTPSTSPAARSIEMRAIPTDVIVFPGERLASVDDFVRMRLHARSPTFVGFLMREGLSLEYYARMSESFAAARAADPSLEATYRARLELALVGHHRR
jgi:hypothetical protein